MAIWLPLPQTTHVQMDTAAGALLMPKAQQVAASSAAAASASAFPAMCKSVAPSSSALRLRFPSSTSSTSSHVWVAGHSLNRRPSANQIALVPDSVRQRCHRAPTTVRSDSRGSAGTVDLERSEDGKAAAADSSPSPVPSSSSPASPSPTPTEASPEVVANLIAFLKRELPNLFLPQGMASDAFEARVEFEDPITRYETIEGYLFNIRMLRHLFDPIFQMHDIYQSGANELTVRWTMKMYFALLPWRPEVVFTGVSIYGINPHTGLFRSHKDVWDSIIDNAYFSREGVVDLVKQMLQLYSPPEQSASPPFDILLRRSAYEVRWYEPYAVAEYVVEQAKGLAGVGNTASFEMGQLASGLPGSKSAKLGLPYTWTLPDQLPSPPPPSASASASAGADQPMRVQRPFLGIDAPAYTEPLSATQLGTSVRRQPGGPVAVISFPGNASLEDFEAAQSLLLSSLLRDGLRPVPGTFTAATYKNSPLLPSFLIRNEVAVQLDNFSWPGRTLPAPTAASDADAAVRRPIGQDDIGPLAT